MKKILYHDTENRHNTRGDPSTYLDLRFFRFTFLQTPIMLLTGSKFDDKFNTSSCGKSFNP